MPRSLGCRGGGGPAVAPDSAVVHGGGVWRAGAISLFRRSRRPRTAGSGPDRPAPRSSPPRLAPDHIPDPSDPTVFTRSRLDWSRERTAEERSRLEWTRRLIRLRTQLCLAMTSGPVHCRPSGHPDVLLLEWTTDLVEPCTSLLLILGLNAAPASIDPTGPIGGWTLETDSIPTHSGPHGHEPMLPQRLVMSAPHTTLHLPAFVVGLYQNQSPITTSHTAPQRPNPSPHV